MSVKKIIQESVNKNPLGVKEALEEALQDRVRAALEEKYAEMMESKDEDDFDLSDLTLEELEDFMMSEDFDQLDEISKSTVKSYASKSWKDAGKAYDKENYGRGDKRMKGYTRALGKLGTKGTSTFKSGGGTPERVKVKATESFDLDEETLDFIDVMLDEGYDLDDAINAIVEQELEEGSIKGSGTDRKAQLKKAYRAGEQKTRDFYKK